jgi:hypothetical protein
MLAKQYAYCRDWHMKKSFGFSQEEYDRMHNEQQGLCACCLEPETQEKKLAIDHDHTTGKVRALLCQRCNTTLGRMNDSPALLQQLINYLEQHSS